MQADLFCGKELTPDSVLAVLQHCVGRANGRTAEELARAVTGRTSLADQRKLRQMIEALRIAGHAVCANPTHGYFMAEIESELVEECQFLLDRANTSLRQIAAMRRVAMPDLRGQLGLPLETTP
ncbi:hypothetical protein FHW84_002826 [Dyella sp. SG562]|uniref:hypothetical protein n=1 Tax=Dyella sp. SG562 TaxID=2587017 RepID=UPI001422815C|nr:hypothetical protein [Dyella sp. SG562]NII74241.1 hypothetical protein [Dyella sp. SG562]